MKSKNFSRRDFIQKGTLASIAATTIVGSSFGQSPVVSKITDKKQTKFNYPSSATKKLTKLLNIEYPIIQAPTAGVINSSFTSAVSNNGGLGALPLSWSEPDYAIKQIEAVKGKTKNSFFANFVLNFEPKAFDIAIENGVPIIQFSWGMPTKKMATKMKAAKVVLGIQVTSEASAKAALDLGADYLVCQGTEAGGHVHASRPLAEALERVLKIAGDVPVVASGGIATGHKMREYMQMGASGVVMGSRFVATVESRGHDIYKKSLVKAKAEDTVFTTCMNKGFENTTHRILRNSTFEMWESAGCPAIGNRPGETDTIVKYGEDIHVERYSINSPGSFYTGNIEAMANYAGTSINDINDIPTVAELIKRIWKEFLDK
ncbi:NAD(P)H-dependent flavin oxidoreductase [Flavivirga spongiicola]|uniref:Nitronate monooxygenase n=1 Tax=Flavivirga spongiicola TaxID=421621 RepID=A0ABU7XWV9_9FLAO|nr:nitronate monooxygenase [Flavivirga sp. MEBiC05379]MDO5980247.1 nitronate monooxygenase [Flavivirga sp. MEBiC05379]